MAEKFSFFNAVVDSAGTYDREYLAEDFATYFASFVGNGIYADSASNLQVTAKGGMVVEVAIGKAWLNGYYYENTAAKNLTLDIADGTEERIDRIVVRLDLINRQITTEIKKGAGGSVAVAPDLQRDSDIYELCLADIVVAANATEITQTAITDTRFNTSLCGIVAGIVNQINTEGLFAQYDDEFYTWFDEVREVLSEDVAGQLQTQITELETKVTEIDGKVTTIRSGTAAPDDSVGVDGDVYIQILA